MTSSSRESRDLTESTQIKYLPKVYLFPLFLCFSSAERNFNFVDCFCYSKFINQYLEINIWLIKASLLREWGDGSREICRLNVEFRSCKCHPFSSLMIRVVDVSFDMNTGNVRSPCWTCESLLHRARSLSVVKWVSCLTFISKNKMEINVELTFALFN